MEVFTPEFLIVVALACLMSGFSKGGLGGTLGALTTPMMALVMPIDLAIGILLPILIVADIFSLATHWRRWDWRIARLLLLGGLCGIGVGTIFISQVSAEQLRRTLGVLVLTFGMVRLLESRLIKSMHYQPRTWHGLLVGGIAGFASTIASAGGPPVVMYLMMLNLPPAIFVATSVLTFSILNWVKVPYYLTAGILRLDLTLQLAWLLPLVPAGVWLGRRLVQRINRVVFERLILSLLLLSGLILIFR